MHIKRRGTRAMLYRSSWVPKGSAGNTHGYSTQTFVASLPLNAQSLPTEIVDKVSEEEVAYLATKIFEPARLAAQEEARAVERRECDPVWRLEEAARLALEAACRSERGAVPIGKVSAVQTALSQVITITKASGAATTRGPESDVPLNGPSRSDPLREALVAINAARDAVAAGRYGKAPGEGVRATYPYRVWADILQAVEGSGDDSLMRALQAKGFAKTRGK